MANVAFTKNKALLTSKKLESRIEEEIDTSRTEIWILRKRKVLKMFLR